MSLDVRGLGGHRLGRLLVTMGLGPVVFAPPVPPGSAYGAMTRGVQFIPTATGVEYEPSLVGMQALFPMTVGRPTVASDSSIRPLPAACSTQFEVEGATTSPLKPVACGDAVDPKTCGKTPAPPETTGAAPVPTATASSSTLKAVSKTPKFST